MISCAIQRECTIRISGNLQQFIRLRIDSSADQIKCPVLDLRDTPMISRVCKNTGSRHLGNRECDNRIILGRILHLRQNRCIRRNDIHLITR